MKPTTMYMRTFICVCTTLGLTALCRAQTPSAPSLTDERRVERRDKQSDLVTLPTVSNPSVPGYSVSFDASSAEKKGSVAIVVGNKDKSLSYSLTASGPLDESTAEATPVTLDGLSNAATVKTGLHWFYWHPMDASRAEKKAFCQQYRKKDLCDDTDFAGDKRLLKKFLELHGADKDPILFDVEGGVGRAAFKYLTPGDLSATEDNHTDWSVGFSLGRYTPTVGYYRVTYEFERAWQAAGRARQLCSPLSSGASTLECKSSIIGSPSRTTLQLSRIELRHFFKGGNAAINPIVSRDFEAGVTGVTVPVYFFSQANGGLAGGGRVSWRSDTKDLSFVVFVGAALKPFG